MTTETPTTLSDMANAVGQPKEPARPGAPRSAAQQIAADAARRERERLDKRKQIRQQIKERTALMQAVADLESQLRVLDAKADQAAAVHGEKATPIQEALAGASGAKRAALLEKLTAANIELEQGLDVINRVRNPLLKQHRETRSAAAKLPTETVLARNDLGKPSLLCEMFAVGKRLEHAEARVEFARDWLATYGSELETYRTTKFRPSSYGHVAINEPMRFDLDAIATLSQRVARWRCELVHAEAELHEATAAIEEITRDMIDE